MANGAMELFRLFGTVFLEGGDATTKQLDGIDKKAGGIGNTLGKVAGGIVKTGAIVGTAVLGVGAAVMGLATKTAQHADAIDETSQKIGISKTAYQEWDYVLSQSGASVDGLQMGVKTLSKAAVEAASGNAQYSDAFKTLGISVTDASGNIKDQETLLNETITALAGMKNETERTAIASSLLGKSATELSPILNGGAEAIQNTKDRAHELGLVMSDEAVMAGGEMADSMETLQATLGALINNAMGPLLPLINDLINEFIKIVPPLLEFIQPLVAKLMPVISTMIDKLLPVFIKLFEALVPILDPLIDVFMLLVDDVLIPFVDLLVPIIDTILPIFIDLFKMLIPVLKPIIDLFFQIVKAVLPPLIDIIKQLAAALMPIIAAILPVVIDLFKKLAPYITQIIDLFMQIVKAVLPPLIAILPTLTPLLMAILNIFMKLVDTVLPAFGSAISWVTKTLVPAISGAFKGLSPIIDGLVGFISALPGKIVSFFTETPAKLLQIGKNIVTGLWDGIKSMASWVETKIKGLFQGILDTVKNIFGIASPSKVFEGFGVNLDKGFANGILKSVGLVENAIGKLSGAASFDGIDVMAGSVKGPVGETGNEYIPRGIAVQSAPSGPTVIINYPKLFNQKDARELGNLLVDRWRLAGAGK